MPTKLEVQDYLKETQSNSVLSASIYFRVEPSDIWKALGQLQPANQEIASCSNPRPKLEICKRCCRNKESSNNLKFSPTKEAGHINHTCEGYVNKNTKSLF